MRLVEAQPFWRKPALAVMQRRGLVGKMDPHTPTVETWLRGVISEKEIPGSSLGVGAGLTPPFLNVIAQNE